MRRKRQNSARAKVGNCLAQADKHRVYGHKSSLAAGKPCAKMGERYLSFAQKPHALSQLYLELMLTNSLMYGLCHK